MAGYGDYTATTEAVSKFSLGGQPTIRRLDGNNGKDFTIKNEDYRLQQILSKSSKDDVRNPFNSDVSGNFQHTKFSTEMSKFSDREYYMLLNEFEAGADSQAYVLKYLASIGNLKIEWDNAYQSKKARLLAEHFSDKEASEIASDYIRGVQNADMAILSTQYPDSVVQRAKEKMWQKPTIQTVVEEKK